MAFSARIREQVQDVKQWSTRQGGISKLEPGPLHYIIVHRLLPTRSLFEDYRNLDVGEIVEFDVPGLGIRTAEVISKSGAFFECAFTRPFDREAIIEKRLESKVVWANFRARSHGPNVTLGELIDVSENIERHRPIVRVGIVGGAAALMWVGIVSLFGFW